MRQISARSEPASPRCSARAPHTPGCAVPLSTRSHGACPSCAEGPTLWCTALRADARRPRSFRYRCSRRRSATPWCVARVISRLRRPGLTDSAAAFAFSFARALQLVELKSGETYNGILVSCDTWMNLHLREVICTSKARFATQRSARNPRHRCAPLTRPCARPERRTATASGACRCATCAATPLSTCACRRRCVARNAARVAFTRVLMALC